MSLLTIIQNFLGYDIDKDIGIIHTSFENSLQSLIKSNIELYLKTDSHSLEFLLLVCYLNKKQQIIDKNTMNKWIHTQPFLKKIKYSNYSLPKKDIKLYGLKWVGNSCYMDSVLLSILAPQSSFIEKNILNKNIDSLKQPLRFICFNEIPLEKDLENRKQIQIELQNIKDSIYTNKIKDSNLLRKAISKCQAQQEFHKYGTQDAGEFLVYLFDLFQIDTATLIRYTYVKNDEHETPILIRRVKTCENPIIDIFQGTLHNLKKDNIYPIDYFIKQEEITHFDEKNLYKNSGKTYQYRIEINKKMSPEYMAFRVHRLGPTRLYKTMLLPTEYIFTSFSVLSLSAIVIYTGGAHYVCVFCVDYIWYYYNDLESEIKTLGSFEKMLKNTPYNPITHGILYIYKK